MLYINLSIVQILLHEIEHANQRKIAYNDNTLEALIIRLSFLINDYDNENLYEYCPEERLAEIKSFEEICTMINYIKDKLFILPNIIETEKLKRELRGYHYRNGYVNIPIFDYFTLGGKEKLIDTFNLPNNSINKYKLNNRLKYGLIITDNEYKNSTKKLILSLEKNFNNRIKID